MSLIEEEVLKTLIFDTFAKFRNDADAMYTSMVTSITTEVVRKLRGKIQILNSVTAANLKLEEYVIFIKFLLWLIYLLKVKIPSPSRTVEKLEDKLKEAEEERDAAQAKLKEMEKYSDLFCFYSSCFRT